MSDEPVNKTVAYSSRNVPASFDPSKLEPLDPVRIEIMRRKSSVDRLAISFRLTRFIRDATALKLHFQHPDWNEEQVEKEVGRRFLNEEIEIDEALANAIPWKIR